MRVNETLLALGADRRMTSKTQEKLIALGRDP